ALARVSDVGASSGRAHRVHAPKLQRFRLGLAALGVIAVAALGAALGLSTGGRTANGPSDWSAWQPPDNGLTGAQEIADYVAPYYRAAPSTQLAVVTAVNLNDPT